MRRSLLETMIGLAVVFTAVAFLILGVRSTGAGGGNGIVVTARFLQIGGLETGADVRVNGIKVGTVVSRTLDPKTFEAVVQLALSSELRVPVDSEAAIAGDGLLGNKYVRLLPGGSKDALASGAVLAKTRDYKSIEDSVSELIYLATGAK